MSERDRDKAKLVLLIGDFMAAKRAGNNQAARELADSLEEFSENTAFENLQLKADAIVTAAALADMQEGLKQMADIADDLSPLRQTFQTAADLANEGEASLFFVRTSSALVQVEGLLSSVLEAADGFERDLVEARDDFDITKLREMIERIASTGRALSDRLGAISA